MKRWYGLAATAAGVFVAVSTAPAAGVASADDVNWEANAQCESDGNWSANTGNGYYGGLQISQATWDEYGGYGSPAAASPQQQVAVGSGSWQPRDPVRGRDALRVAVTKPRSAR